MKNVGIITIFFLLVFNANGFAQSPSFDTYVNPVIPGDHPDPTLTKIDNYFYTSGSSFNPTPKIYRSTDLVHWEAIAQPVKSTWSVYGNQPGGGIWGGHMVRYNDTYWHYFGRGGGSMYFVTADQPEGPWSEPVRVIVPSGLNGLGVDNSIFIDEENGKWYLVAKPERAFNEIVELGNDGQPTGNIISLSWLNPQREDETYPYGWAEGPVMWKHDGSYFYSFAQHLAGDQYVMRSDTLSSGESDWEIKPDPMNYGGPRDFRTPNHIAPAVKLENGTSWTIGHSYHSDWITQGRQGLLLEITYDEDGFPQFEYPRDEAIDAPDLPSNGVPWAVPSSDMFAEAKLHPEWSFLGSAPGRSLSLTDRPGWLRLGATSRGNNTIIKNDGEHQYTLITRLDFEAESPADQAGLYIMNGPENLEARVFSTANDEGEPELVFVFDRRDYDEPNPIGSVIWLKLERNQHDLSAYYSADGADWIQIGREIDAAELNIEQTQFNSFTGNQQGLFTQGKDAYFDLYIYRDAYSIISANEPINYSGVEKGSSSLESIQAGDWALYAGVEFGTEVMPASGFDYQRTPDSLFIEASSGSSGGIVEVWLDSIETGTKIGEVTIENTGSFSAFEEFSAVIDSANGKHDVYLYFNGADGEELFEVSEFMFTPRRVPLATSNEIEKTTENPKGFELNQNYPNPFNPTTNVTFNLPQFSNISLTIHDITGRKVAQLIDNKSMSSGLHKVTFNASGFASGVYFYRLQAGDFFQTRKMILVK